MSANLSHLLPWLTVVEWAELPIIDFSAASTPEGRAALVPQVCNAMQTYGFMYLVNHGLTQAQVSTNEQCMKDNLMIYRFRGYGVL